MKNIQRFIGILLSSLVVLVLGSCCNRPYISGNQTWPQANKYPKGPYEIMVSCYKVQSGRCPKPDDKGANITITIWDWNYDNKLFNDTIKTDKYYMDIVAEFAKDGSVLVVDEKSGEVIRQYERVSVRQWKAKDDATKR